MKKLIASLLLLFGVTANAANSPIIYANGCAYNLLSQACLGGGGASISDLNGLTVSTQMFAVGTSGTDFSINSSSATHTFNLPTANASNRGLLSSADWTRLIPTATVSYWVDGSRSAQSYTADGSFGKPYKSIMAGVNRIIANADNSDSNKYQLLIMGSQTYAENIVLENTLLTDLFFECVGPQQSCKVTPASGNSLQSNANNGLLHFLIMHGFVFDSPVSLIGSGLANFLSNTGVCAQCVFNDTQTITNAGDWEIHGGSYAGDIAMDGSVIFLLNGASGQASVTIHNGSILVMDDAVLTGTIDIDADSSLQARGGARLGSDGGTLTNAGLMTMYPSFIRSNIANSGTMNMRGGNYRANVMTNTGTINREVPLENYASFTSGSVTCTGSAQNVAHGLGYAPAHVLISAQDTTAVVVTGYTITEGTHTSTNVVLTCTSGLKVKVMAF